MDRKRGQNDGLDVREHRRRASPLRSGSHNQHKAILRILSLVWLLKLQQIRVPVAINGIEDSRRCTYVRCFCRKAPTDPRYHGSLHTISAAALSRIEGSLTAEKARIMRRRSKYH